jgi:hypothetical protein
MPRKKQYIDGIYNYCDSWCERCPFTERCRSFAMQRSIERLNARRDKQNAEFWAAMQRTLGDKLDEVAKLADALEPPREARADTHAVDDPIERPVRQHPLAKMSMQYADDVDAWFDRHPEKPPGESPESDALEIIRWYTLFIHVKLCRALSGALKVHADEDTDDLRDENGLPYPKDSDGSAKISIIAIERSMSAWSVMRENYPRDEKLILNVLARLYRLRTLADSTFPNARSFHRPGFDDEHDE